MNDGLGQPSLNPAQYGWHQVRLHGVSIQSDSPKTFSVLKLDIDYVTQLESQSSQAIEFLVAPATVVFENVSRLRIDADSGQFEPGYLIINRVAIESERLTARPGVPHSRWKFTGDWFDIEFSTTGGSIFLRKQPVRTSTTWFSTEDHGDVSFRSESVR
jgi:hypothetical protein